MLQNCTSSWMQLLLLLLLLVCFVSSNTYSFSHSGKNLDNSLVRQLLIGLDNDLVKRGGDSCGCNLGCFFTTVEHCASCCALGL
ncbi:hypothetical protein L596_018967 [Steinernema carpocapsae]|uniref:Uncharacterized protein n=1 Tax=Steinernema carpocapsae TaxID=34508 RepID=A0A4U5N674_STECR|nr:hypothetical protein L596_018967 [Steinernema carpocapsae]